MLVLEEKKEGSPRFGFNMEDLMSVLRTALMVGSAAALTFIVDNLGKIEMGENMLIVIPMVTMAIKALIRWIKDNTFKPAVVVVEPKSE